jgi:TonB family protein
VCSWLASGAGEQKIHKKQFFNDFHRCCSARMTSNMSATAVSRTVETWRQWTGKVLNGKYRLGQYLGGSKHSAVFLTEYGRGEDRRKAAIKLIPAGPDEGSRFSRWEKDQGLWHPHLLRIFDKGRCELEETRLLYIVMEHAEEDLSQILPTRPLSAQEVREMLKPVLEALAYLHGQRLVHGHLQPANILAVQDQVKISSDNLVDPLHPHATLSSDANSYSAPELKAGRISSASDVWSLGGTLVAALMQGLPKANGDRRNSSLSETVPQPFLDIARNCLVAEETRRWTIAQIREGLAPAASQGMRSVVTQAVAMRRAASPPPKKIALRKYAPFVAVAALAIAGFLGAKLFKQSSPSSTKQNVDVQQTSSAAIRTESARTTAAGIVNGAVTQQVLPDISRGARNTIHGKIRVIVRVSVEPTGNVAGTAFQVRGPSNYFARKTMEAARQWKFTPPEVDGKPLASAWSLRFAIARGGTEVYPTQIAPAP